MLKSNEWILFSSECEVERDIEGNRKKEGRKERVRKTQIIGTISKTATASTSQYKSNIAFTETTTQTTGREAGPHFYLLLPIPQI